MNSLLWFFYTPSVKARTRPEGSGRLAAIDDGLGAGKGKPVIQNEREAIIPIERAYPRKSNGAAKPRLLREEGKGMVLALIRMPVEVI
jgi:hypothetical protein